MKRRDFFRYGLALGGGTVSTGLNAVGSPGIEPRTRIPKGAKGNPVSGGDLALVNAQILTMEPQQPEAEAALVQNGRIVLVGSGDDVRAEAGGVPVFDAARRVVVPGFVDAHCHMELTCLAASYQVPCHAPPFTSLHEILGALRTKAADTPKGEWVIGRSSFGLRRRVVEQELPTRHELDAITEDHPLVLFSGLHVGILNTRALKELGLWNRAANPPRGIRMHREASGAPTGVATEVWSLLPPYSVNEVRAAVKEHARELFISKGTTSISTIPLSANDIRADQELQASGDLPVRLRVYYHVPRQISLPSLIDTGLMSGVGDEMFQFGGIKIFINGTTNDGLGNPIDDFKWSQEELNGFVSSAHVAGFQLIMHVASRDAMLMIANAVEEAERNHPRPHRHRIEHGGDHLDSLEDMKRMRELGLLMVATPHFARGGSTGQRTPRFKTMIEEGLELICATDTTGTVPGSGSPLFNIACTMTGSGDGGAAPNPEEALEFEEALRTHTLWAAAGGFEDQDKGSVAVGKLGDFAVLSDDPRRREGAELFDVEVDATILGGDIVFER